MIEKMQKAGVMFGYSRTRRHPSAARFISGSKNRIDLFDLNKTKEELDKAKDFVKKLASENKEILLVGTKPECRQIIEETALKLGLPYVSVRWIGGTLTNFVEIKKRIEQFKELSEKKQSGELETKYTKKERSLFDREIKRLEQNFGGIVQMEKSPAALFIVDAKEESTALREAKSLKIPVVSLSSSDCDLGEIDYPIPGNDAATSSIRTITAEIATAYEAGVEEKKSEPVKEAVKV